MNAHLKSGSKTCLVGRPFQNGARGGFTLTELLVVLATLGILAAVVLPALAGTQPRSKAFQCLNNMRQLALAWTVYAGENNERLAINTDPHVYNTTIFPPQSGGTPSWITGSLDWSTGQYNTNTSYLTDDAHSLLGSYLGRSAKMFACPASNFLSPAERSIGWTQQRARSVAMNAAIGDGDKFSEPFNPFNFTQWYVARKSTDFNSPAPGKVWVFMDEHPDSIDDGLMYFSPYPTSDFIELPGNQHEGAAGITFADGHVEMHKWTGTVVPKRPVTYLGQYQVACLPSDTDMVWLSQHTPAR